MLWNTYLRGFKMYLHVEKGLSEHTISSYLHDVEKLSRFISGHYDDLPVSEVMLSIPDLLWFESIFQLPLPGGNHSLYSDGRFSGTYVRRKNPKTIVVPG